METKCKFCGAKMVTNPHTGKVFCSEKCWLKNQTPEQKRASAPADFKRSLEKDEREEGQSKGNAKNIAGLWVAHGIISKEEWEAWTDYVFSYEPKKVANQPKLNAGLPTEVKFDEEQFKDDLPV